MTASNYPESLRLVLKHEGGYTNHPDDPGGPTNYGITIKDARMYWKPNATAEDVKAMPLSVAKSIYKSKYWDRMDCDNLPSGVDYCVFDYGVNSGTGRSVKVYQKFASLAPIACINKMCDERMHFLQSLHTWPTFGKGWTVRVSDVRKHATGMVKAEPEPEPEPAPEPEVKQPWWKKIWTWASGSGIGLGGLSLYDWRVAAVIGGIGALIFIIVWFTFLRDYLKKTT